MAATPTFTSTLSIGELIANYSLYCKALRILVREGTTVEKARRTVCWTRLQSLHQCLPREYRDPEQLFFLLRRELQTGKKP
jgi:hypothetical protein